MRRADLAAAALGALLVRAMVGQGPHSGLNSPPMRGDFEAQRHWMEVTLNLPISDWYVGKLPGNDLLYWGLDYPPLTAYHSLACAKAINVVSPKTVAWLSSRGEESPETRVALRLSALVSDAVTFVPAVLMLFQPSTTDVLGMALALTAPGFILIDHGHFQYNCIAHGLVLLALVILGRGEYISARQAALASMSFCLSLNFKQMSLYYAPIFFAYLLGWAGQGASLREKLERLITLGVTVIATFTLLWLPFILNGTWLQVLRRIFPVERGIFEDKVANFWCSANVFIKWRLHFTHLQLALLALGLTVVAILPACVRVFLDRSERTLAYGLFACALGFFLCSFQVHEKSILLALVPASTLFRFGPTDASAAFWFAVVSSLTMTPLYIKDGIGFTSVFLTSAYALIGVVFYMRDRPWKLIDWLGSVMVFALSVTSLAVAFYKNPAHLPDLAVVIHNVVSFACLVGFYMFANAVLFQPQLERIFCSGNAVSDSKKNE